jgi:hypothetical protein
MPNSSHFQNYALATASRWYNHYMCLEDAALFNSRRLSHGGINILYSVKEILLLDIRLNLFYSDKLDDTHE